MSSNPKREGRIAFCEASGTQNSKFSRFEIFHIYGKVIKVHYDQKYKIEFCF
jgi:hypothetical protein